MRTVCSMLVGLALVAAMVMSVQADDKKADKEVTLKGNITCAKCELKLEGATKCATVIKVKDAVYYFDGDAHKKYHKDICKEGKEGTVKGTVSEKDKKKTIKVTSLEYAK